MSAVITDINVPARPFVKWVGGKRAVLPILLKSLPEQFGHYYEPFVGGGALFFALQAQDKQADRQRYYNLSDSNNDLINCYRVIATQTEDLIAILQHHAICHNKDYYYYMRSQHDLSDDVARAARFIYLNRTCFNGLYRVNKSGRFNVPMGRYKNPRICAVNDLHAVCQALADNVQLRCHNYQAIQPMAGDLVYFDPPYHRLNATSFTTYSVDNFGALEQEALADFALSLHKQGVKIMLSNSDTPLIHDLYRLSVFQIQTLQAPRLVNCRAAERSLCREVLITNY